MRAYEARKKLEMIGAMMFNSASGQKTGLTFFVDIFILYVSYAGAEGLLKQLTNQDEGKTNAEGQNVTTERLIVPAITLCKHTKSRIDVVLTESLE